MRSVWTGAVIMPSLATCEICSWEHIDSDPSGALYARAVHILDTDHDVRLRSA